MTKQLYYLIIFLFRDPGPWCYNSQGTEPRFEYCDFPMCNEGESVFIHPIKTSLTLVNSISLWKNICVGKLDLVNERQITESKLI